MKDWLPLAGTIIAALIAGLFALRQQQRAAASQRQLERQKLLAARREAEISEERATAAKFRQNQVLPFLEKLDESLTKSVQVAQLPEFFPDLGGYVPQIRRHSDETIGEWWMAMEAMSRLRMQLLLAIDPERIPVVVSLLTRLVEQALDISKTRHNFWFKQASSSDLWAVQREYVRTGYRLMMEIKEAVMSPSREAPVATAADKDKLANDLAIPFEKASVVSIPYGSVSDFSWVAIWQIDLRPDWQKFEESLTHTTVAEFAEALKELVHRLYEQKEVVDSQLCKIQSDEIDVFCLSAKLPGAERLRLFEEVDLPNYRCEFKILWSSLRSPIEFTIGRRTGMDRPSQAMDASDKSVANSNSEAASNPGLPKGTSTAAQTP